MDPVDRRRHRRHASDELSPEYLAMLVLCGGEVREGDRADLPEHVKNAHAKAPVLDSARKRDVD